MTRPSSKLGQGGRKPTKQKQRHENECVCHITYFPFMNLCENCVRSHYVLAAALVIGKPYPKLAVRPCARHCEGGLRGRAGMGWKDSPQHEASAAKGLTSSSRAASTEPRMRNLSRRLGDLCRPQAPQWSQSLQMAFLGTCG